MSVHISQETIDEIRRVEESENRRIRNELRKAFLLRHADVWTGIALALANFDAEYRQILLDKAKELLDGIS